MENIYGVKVLGIGGQISAARLKGGVQLLSEPRGMDHL